MKKVGIPKASEVKGALAPGLAAVIAHDCMTIWRNDRQREWKDFWRKAWPEIIKAWIEADKKEKEV